VARSDPNAQFARYQRQLERQAQREHARDVAAAAREQEKEAKTRFLEARRAEAAERAEAASSRLAALEGLLAAALARPVAAVDLGEQRRPPPTLPLDLGRDADPLPPPEWSRFEPPLPGVVARALGKAKHDRAVADARSAFAVAQRHHSDEESARVKRVDAARRRHATRLARLADDVRTHNETVERIAAGLTQRDRIAVSGYFDLAIGSIEDPPDFPNSRRTAYVPESEMLVVDWDLPSFDVVPATKNYAYVQRTDEIKATALALAPRRATYRRLIASMALRAVWLVFRSDPHELVDTVVVNGMIDQIDPSTGQDVRRCLVSLRATREKFDSIRIDRVDPVKCVQQHFAADVSEHPDELSAVPPVIEFDMADPRVIDPVDILSEIDKRPNLLELDGYELEHFVQNLFTRMGLTVQVFRPGGDGGIDCVVYDPTPVFGGKFVVQAKRYSKTVPPTAVRDLHGTVQSEGATKGLLITTSGFGQSSYAWATGKPLHLMSGTELLGLCRQHDIPARIVHKR
jgi:restriction system protein